MFPGGNDESCVADTLPNARRTGLTGGAPKMLFVGNGTEDSILFVESSANDIVAMADNRLLVSAVVAWCQLLLLLRSEWTPTYAQS